jgi:3-methyladenine DNA glycosylase/8-oxoguanine DNA glycosylase
VSAEGAEGGTPKRARAVERVWGLELPASVAQVDAVGERFRPWRTLAATYLYRTRAA